VEKKCKGEVEEKEKIKGRERKWERGMERGKVKKKGRGKGKKRERERERKEERKGEKIREGEEEGEVYSSGFTGIDRGAAALPIDLMHLKTYENFAPKCVIFASFFQKFSGEEAICLSAP